jgi:hypothetical protein
VALLFVGVSLAAACEKTPPHPTQELPPGAHLLGEGAAIASLIGPWGKLGPVPAARWSEALRDKAAGCDGRLYARADDLTGLPAAVVCEPKAGAVPPTLEAIRAGADAVIVLPDAGPEGARAFARLAQGALLIDVPPDEPSLLGLLRPGEEAARGSPLVTTEVTASGWWRSRSLGPLLSKIQFADSSENPLADLLSSRATLALLDGHWGFVLKVDEDKGRFGPILAASLGFERETLARQFLDGVFAVLDQRYQLRPVPMPLEGRPTAQCIEDFAVLANMRPCAAIVGRDIVVAWNEQSIETLLAQERGPKELSFQLDLVRADADDRQLTERLGGDARSLLTYPADGLRAEPQGELVHLVTRPRSAP